MAKLDNDNIKAHDTKEKKSEKVETDLFMAVLLGSILLAFLAVSILPVVVGYILYVFAISYFRKSEAWIAFVTGVVGIVIFPLAGVLYVKWLISWVHGPSFPPVGADIFILEMGVLIGVIIRAIGAVSIQSLGRSKAATRMLFKRRIFNQHKEHSILPDDSTKISTQPSSVPLVIAPKTHVVADGGKAPGKREFPIGYGVRNAIIKLSEEEVGEHMVIVGSTGIGKTKTIQTIAGGLLDLGWDGLVLDLKEDVSPGGLKDWCKVYAGYHSIPFQELGLSDPYPEYYFNPLLGIDVDEARDLIVSQQTFEAAYYESLNKQQLGQLCDLYYNAHMLHPGGYRPPSIYDMGKTLSKLSKSQEIATRVKVVTASGIRSESDYAQLLHPDKAFEASAPGLGARLTNIYETRAGRTVLSPSGGKRSLQVTESGLTYIGLDSLGKGELTNLIASSVLQRMSIFAAERTRSGTGMIKRRFIIVDEASTINRQIVAALLSKARSAGITVILCTQGPLDWGDSNEENNWDQLSNNINVGIVMQQTSLTQAEACADYIGMKEVTEVSQKISSGVLSLDGVTKKVRTWEVSPDEIKNKMGKGDAIVVVSKPKHRVNYAKIAMRDPQT